MSNRTLAKAALYEGKAAVDKYVKELGIPAAYFVPASYKDLFKSFFAFKKVSAIRIRVSKAFSVPRPRIILTPSL
jgi:hypothetical protein